MKKRFNKNGSNNDNWETPEYIYIFIEEFFGIKKKDLYDPCPINSEFDGLNIRWYPKNYVNPPYSRKLKELFIHKALEQSKRGSILQRQIVKYFMK